MNNKSRQLQQAINFLSKAIIEQFDKNISAGKEQDIIRNEAIILLDNETESRIYISFEPNKQPQE